MRRITCVRQSKHSDCGSSLGVFFLVWCLFQAQVGAIMLVVLTAIEPAPLIRSRLVNLHEFHKVLLQNNRLFLFRQRTKDCARVRLGVVRLRLMEICRPMWQRVFAREESKTTFNSSTWELIDANAMESGDILLLHSKNQLASQVQQLVTNTNDERP